ncbi:MAG: argininosuccinate lyase [Bacteroidia bacterium]|nr:argininosuccinate lyase [Bacteroidia bacterium]
MKLWDKGYHTNLGIETFTVGRDRDLDQALAPWDILGTMAHITMLRDIGLIEPGEWKLLIEELKSLHEIASRDELTIEEGVEDIHSQVELMLTRKLGDLGKKVHAGRSRNDQVLVDLKLFFLHRIQTILGGVETLFDSLQAQSEKYKGVLLPGYTHYQVAMPSSFGLWFGAYAEALVDDVYLFQAAWKASMQNPLGSAAGYGSSFPLNRSQTTALLGFDTLAYNVVYAQMGRGKTEKILSFAMAGLATTLNKLASDVCLYMSQNFGFVTLPRELTTGSSIMPHKKNPDVFEIMRGRTNRLQSLPTELSMLTTNLPSGYHRDLQLTKEVLLPALDSLEECLAMANFMVQRLEVRQDILDNPMYDYLFSVEAVNAEVLSGLPFREAYRKIGMMIDQGEFQPERQVNHTHEGSIGHLCTSEIKAKMDHALAGVDAQPWRDALSHLLQ